MARFKELCFVLTQLPPFGDFLPGAIWFKQGKFDIHNFCDCFAFGNNGYNYFIPVGVTGSHLMDQPGIGGSLDYFPRSEVAAGMVQRVEA